MKLFLTLLLTLLLITHCGKKNTPPKSDLFNDDNADETVESTEKITAKAEGVEIARQLAEKILEVAVENTKDPQTKTLFRMVEAALKAAKINAPARGKDLKGCQEDLSILAFVKVKSPKTIHLCSRAVKTNKKQLAQVLIHESAHVIGIHDECEATRVEVAAMRLSGATLAFENGYMEHCNLTP